MNREKLFSALGDIDPRYVAEAVHYAPEEAAAPSERSKHMKSKRILSLALAAALILALGFTAYGLYLGFEYRRPAAEETFSIHWDDSPDGTITWSDAKLAVTLPELEESREIEFRTGWLPGDMLSLQSAITATARASRLTGARCSLCRSRPTAAPSSIRAAPCCCSTRRREISGRSTGTRRTWMCCFSTPHSIVTPCLNTMSPQGIMNSTISCS